MCFKMILFILQDHEGINMFPTQHIDQDLYKLSLQLFKRDRGDIKSTVESKA